MKKQVIIGFLLFWALGVGTGKAEDNKYAASFLELGIGGRALGMGGAQVALSADAYGSYWNPAGLAFLPHFQAASMYAHLFNTLETQSFGSVAMPVFGGASIALSWIRLSVSDIPRYEFDDTQIFTAFQRIHGQADPLTAEPTDYFGSYDDAYFISFAKLIPLNVDLGWQYFEVPVEMGFGVNLKILNLKLDDRSGSGMGLDVGWLTHINLSQIFGDEHYGDLTFGLNMQDVANTTITWDTDSKHKDRVYRNFKYGFAYQQPLAAIDSRFSVAMDLNSVYEGSIHYGFEFLFKDLLAVRAGSNNGFFTAGAGLYLWKFKLDYAYQSHDLGNTHRVSVLFGL